MLYPAKKGSQGGFVVDDHEYRYALNVYGALDGKSLADQVDRRRRVWVGRYGEHILGAGPELEEVGVCCDTIEEANETWRVIRALPGLVLGGPPSLQEWAKDGAPLAWDDERGTFLARCECCHAPSDECSCEPSLHG